jgi:hypothetical protein
MKVKTNDIPLEMGGVQVEGEFRIRNSAKAFSILSSGLYSNKIEAILRELGCNAYDSHVEAGKADVPFTVHLPTSINPQFYVRDYGIGLDHDGVTKLYTTYFESTKQDSNDFVGCLGLGSKSPFSYTRSFTVTAIKDGVERIYNCFINESGIPSVALLNEQKTDAGNGVEVRFAVNNRHEMGEFAQTAQTVYRWFKVKPEIIGNAITVPEVKFKERDIAPGVHILDGRYGRNGYYSRECFAMMGNVVYPIKLPENGKVEKGIHNLLMNGNYLFEFNIGDLDVAASREELSYDDATVNALVSKAQILVDNAATYLAKQVDSEKTDWQKLIKLLKVVGQDVTLFTSALNQYLKTASPVIKSLCNANVYGARIQLTLPMNMASNEKIALNYLEAESTGNSDNIRLSRRSQSTDYNNQKVSWQLETDTVFIVQNDRGNLLGRIRKACEDEVNGLKSGKKMLVVRRARRDGNTEAMWKKLSKMLGNPQVIYSSALPQLEKAVKTKHGEVKAYSFERCSGNSRWAPDIYRFRPGPKKLAGFTRIDGKIIYLPLYGKQAKWAGGVISASDLLIKMDSKDDDGLFGFINDGQTQKVSAESVYGLNGASLAAAEKNPDWVSLFDFVNERLNKMDWSALELDVELAAKASVLENGALGISTSTPSNRPLMGYEHPTSPYGQLVREVLSLKGAKKALAQLTRLQRATRLLPDRKGKVEELEKRRDAAVKEMNELVEKVKSRYPLIKYLSQHHSEQAKMETALREYIEAIDNRTN